MKLKNIGAQRHDREEDHRRAVHREQLRCTSRATRRCCPGVPSCMRMMQRLDAADQEEDERGDAVEDADPLVVDRGEPAPEAGLFSVRGGCVRPCADLVPWLPYDASWWLAGY